MTLYSTVVETSDVDDAFVQASITMGLDPALLQNVDTASLGDWYLVRSEDSAGLQHGYAAQQVGSTVIVIVVRGNEPGINPESPNTMRIVASTKLTGKVETVIESYADLEELVRAQVDGLAGSVSLALVHNGEIVYTYTYGEANPVEGIPADANTIYPWGSMSKILTAVAAMQEHLTALDGSDLGMGLGWWHGEDDFGPFVYHAGSVNAGEALMRVYREQDVAVVVMGSVMDYRPGKILDTLMQAWANEGR